MTSKPYEIVYISTFQIPTQEGNKVMYLAMDDYSEVIFEPVMSPLPKNEEETIDNLVQLFNGINENYDRNKHAQVTIYVTDYPKELHPFMRAVIMKDDSLVFDPKKTEKALKPFIDGFLQSLF